MRTNVHIGVVTLGAWTLHVRQDGTFDATHDGEPVPGESLSLLHALDADATPLRFALGYLRLWREHAPDLPVSVVCLFAERTNSGRVWQFAQFDDADQQALVPLLVRDPSAQVRSRVAAILPKGKEHRRWFTLLAKDPSTLVTAAVMGNANAPRRVLASAALQTLPSETRTAAQATLRARAEAKGQKVTASVARDKTRGRS